MTDWTRSTPQWIVGAGARGYSVTRTMATLWLALAFIASFVLPAGSLCADEGTADLKCGLAANQGNRWAAERQRVAGTSLNPAAIVGLDRRIAEWQPRSAGTN